MIYFILFLIFEITIYYVSSFCFFPPNPPKYPSSIFLKFMASFFIKCYFMHIYTYVWIYTFLINPHNPYNVTFMYVMSSSMCTCLIAQLNSLFTNSPLAYPKLKKIFTELMGKLRPFFSSKIILNVGTHMCLIAHACTHLPSSHRSTSTPDLETKSWRSYTDYRYGLILFSPIVV